MEIERKFLIAKLPSMEAAERVGIEQGYISVDPVIRIRRKWTDAGESYVLTVKGSGMVVRQEYELELSRAQYEGLKEKCVGERIVKTRYKYPLSDGLVAEVDVFDGTKKGLILAEVEFPDTQSMEHFQKPDWFGEEVSQDRRYHNSNMVLEGRNGEL